MCTCDFWDPSELGHHTANCPALNTVETEIDRIVRREGLREQLAKLVEFGPLNTQGPLGFRITERILTKVS